MDNKKRYGGACVHVVQIGSVVVLLGAVAGLVAYGVFSFATKPFDGTGEYTNVEGYPFVQKNRYADAVRYGGTHDYRPTPFAHFETPDVYFLSSDGSVLYEEPASSKIQPIVDAQTTPSSVFFSATHEVHALCLFRGRGGLTCTDAPSDHDGTRRRRQADDANATADPTATDPVPTTTPAASTAAAPTRCFFGSDNCHLVKYHPGTNPLPSTCNAVNVSECSVVGLCQPMSASDPLYLSNIVAGKIRKPYGVCVCPSNTGGWNCSASISAHMDTAAFSEAHNTSRHLWAAAYTPITGVTCLYGRRWNKTHCVNETGMEGELDRFRIQKRWNGTANGCNDGYTGPTCNAMTFRREHLIDGRRPPLEELQRLANATRAKSGDAHAVSPLVVQLPNGTCVEVARDGTAVPQVSANVLNIVTLDRDYRVYGYTDNGYTNMPNRYTVFAFAATLNPASVGMLKEAFPAVYTNETQSVSMYIDGILSGVCVLDTTTLHCLIPGWSYYKTGQTDKYAYVFEIVNGPSPDDFVLKSVVHLRPYEQAGEGHLYASVPFGVYLTPNNSTDPPPEIRLSESGLGVYDRLYQPVDDMESPPTRTRNRQHQVDHCMRVLFSHPYLKWFTSTTCHSVSRIMADPTGTPAHLDIVDRLLSRFSAMSR